MISLPALDYSATMQTSTTDAKRRRFLGVVTSGIMGAIGAILGVIGGGAVLSSAARRQDEWLAASTLHDLPDNEPTPVTLSVLRQDGYRQTLQRRTIFLVKTGESEVAALDSTCSHLGCLVAWDATAQGSMPRRRVRPRWKGHGRTSSRAADKGVHSHRR